MLREGELDAAIYGADLPDDPNLTSVIAEPATAAQRWYAQRKAVPINHMVVVTEKLAASNPAAVTEVYRLLAQSKQAAQGRAAAAGAADSAAIDLLPFGFEACRPALETVIGYALQQSLIPRKIDVAELFDATTSALAS
jgi:4,5-dihydroxyphthalate decarboxylase